MCVWMNTWCKWINANLIRCPRCDGWLSDSSGAQGHWENNKDTTIPTSVWRRSTQNTWRGSHHPSARPCVGSWSCPPAQSIRPANHHVYNGQLICIKHKVIIPEVVHLWAGCLHELIKHQNASRNCYFANIHYYCSRITRDQEATTEATTEPTTIRWRSTQSTRRGSRRSATRGHPWLQSGAVLHASFKTILHTPRMWLFRIYN